MKSSNSILWTLALLMLGLTTLTSCKKGEEDPGLSLLSRKARLTGEWKLKDGTTNNSYSSGSTTFSSTTTYNGTTATNTPSVGNPTTYSYTETMIFEKDNTFSITYTEDGDITVADGFWSFLRAYNDEVEDKEAIILRISKITETSNGASATETYTGDQMPSVIFRFKRLANKTCTIAEEGKETGTSTYIYSSEKNYEKQ